MKNKKFRAYIVDNDWLEIQAIKMLVPFRKHGFKVTGCSTDPEKAVERILTLKPDLVLCEWNLDNTDGISLMNLLKNKGINCEYIMLTASRSSAVCRNFFKNGGRDFWMKPFSVSEGRIASETLRALYSELEQKRLITV